MRLPTEFEHNHVHDKLAKHIKRGKKIMKYLGASTIQDLFMIYLLNKYKSNCAIITSYKGVEYGIELQVTKEMPPDKNREYLAYINKSAHEIVKCIGRGINPIVIPLTLSVKSEGSSHANLLIVREDTIEQFEPHGERPGFADKNDKDYAAGRVYQLVRFINKNIREYNQTHSKQLRELTLTTSDRVCPYRNGLQALEQESLLPKDESIEGGGYCLAWSMFFAELVLTNPNISSKHLHYMVYQMFNGINGRDYLRRMIRGYVNYMSSKLDKYFTILFGESMSLPKILELLKTNLARDKIFTRTLAYLFNLEYKSANETFDINNEVNILNEERNEVTNDVNLSNSEKEKKNLLIDAKLNLLNRYTGFRTKFDEVGPKSSPDSEPEAITVTKKALSKNASPKKSPTKNDSPKKSPTKNDSPKKSPDKNASHKKSSDKKSSDKKASDKNASDKKSSDKNASTQSKVLSKGGKKLNTRKYKLLRNKRNTKKL